MLPWVVGEFTGRRDGTTEEDVSRTGSAISGRRETHALCGRRVIFRRILGSNSLKGRGLAGEVGLASPAGPPNDIAY